MSILVFQLSDTHIQTEKDPVLSKAAQIVDAIAADVDPNVSGCILINAGDSTNWGIADQYRVAHELFATIKDRLCERLGPGTPVELLVIPGNHDCNLSGDQAARNA